MADIGHRIGIAAQPADVYAQLTTSEGLAQWWTRWAYFLLGMKAGLEGGAPMPFPDEVPISSWG